VRLFTGISIDSGTLTNLEKLLDELRPLAQVKWSPVENLHITIRFIGEWPEARLGELEAALAGIDPAKSFEIKIGGLDYYPDGARPRALFAGITAPPKLNRLAEATSEALATIGLAREERDYSPHVYSPHLTLARIRNENIHKLRERIKNMSNTEFGKFEVREFHLYLSKASPHGSVYSKLRTYPIC
jgi:2'-5' RNA ligase